MNITRMYKIMSLTIDKAIIDARFIAMDRETAYRIGMILGEMRYTLRKELSKELEEEDERMSLTYEMSKYTGVPTGILGRYLDGYEKGRADQKAEDEQLPNGYSERLYKIAYAKGRADAIDECKQIMEDYTSVFVGTYYYNLLIDKFEQLKERKK